MNSSILYGDCLDHMKNMGDNSIDFIVTDPPYGIGWDGRKWDKDTPEAQIWKEALRICKPGSMLAAFGHSRTVHRLTCAIEDAGWEIRDTIMWIHGQGFPKGNNHIGLEGYGTALKPAHEPIILAMKPLEGTYKKNVEKWGIGGINIDASRIKTNDKLAGGPQTPEDYSKGKGVYHRPWMEKESERVIHSFESKKRVEKAETLGRHPANVIFDEEAGRMLDEQSGWSKTTPFVGGKEKQNQKYLITKTNAPNLHNDCGGASRFFYCAKPSPAEREGNAHPTVKPIALMKYIIKLLAPPNNPILLDIFAGSGTTLVAAQEIGIRSIGIEREQVYTEIAMARLEKKEE